MLDRCRALLAVALLALACLVAGNRTIAMSVGGIAIGTALGGAVVEARVTSASFPLGAAAAALAAALLVPRSGTLRGA